MSYENIVSLKSKDYSGFRVLLIGAGWMARQYADALLKMGVREFSFISKSEKSALECKDVYGCHTASGGYERELSNHRDHDLAVICTPILDLAPAATMALDCGCKNILVEKPGALSSEPLKELQRKASASGARVRVAHNRMLYPNLWKLKSLAESEGGITSCRYTFTELIRTIDFDKEKPEIYEKWGLANSLHVIGMAHSMIGLPREMDAYIDGSLSWHPRGAIFTGSGVTENEILFSYHADWLSGGRWGVEIMTPEYAYRFIPLEQLFRCPRGYFDWEPVEFEAPFPGVKQGVAEQVAVMLLEDMEKDIPLPTLDQAIDLLSLGEKILGYSG